jgi:hypothetical protein
MPLVDRQDGDAGIGEAPRTLEFRYSGRVYDLEVGGVAYQDAFLNEDQRKAALGDLTFLDVAP